VVAIAVVDARESEPGNLVPDVANAVVQAD